MYSQSSTSISSVQSLQRGKEWEIYRSHNSIENMWPILLIEFCINSNTVLILSSYVYTIHVNAYCVSPSIFAVRWQTFILFNNCFCSSRQKARKNCYLSGFFYCRPPHSICWKQSESAALLWPHRIGSTHLFDWICGWARVHVCMYCSCAWEKPNKWRNRNGLGVHLTASVYRI